MYFQCDTVFLISWASSHKQPSIHLVGSAVPVGLTSQNLNAISDLKMARTLCCCKQQCFLMCSHFTNQNTQFWSTNMIHVFKKTFILVQITLATYQKVPFSSWNICWIEIIFCNNSSSIPCIGLSPWHGIMFRNNSSSLYRIQ